MSPVHTDRERILWHHVNYPQYAEKAVAQVQHQAQACEMFQHLKPLGGVQQWQLPTQVPPHSEAAYPHY